MKTLPERLITWLMRDDEPLKPKFSYVGTVETEIGKLRLSRRYRYRWQARLWAQFACLSRGQWPDYEILSFDR